MVGPLFLALFQAVGTYGASRGQPDRHAVDALALALVIAGPAALLLVRRYPRAVLIFIAVLTWVYLARDYPYGPVFASLAIAAVLTVVAGHRLSAWVVVACLYGAQLVFYLAFAGGPTPWAQLSGTAAWALLLLVVGEVVRARRERSQISRRARAETERRRANEERLRIARELHDVVAHHMSMINMQAGIALPLVEKRPEQAQTALAAIKAASGEALGELRSLVTVLRDEADLAPRQPVSTLSSTDDLIERSAFAGLAVRRVVLGAPRELPARCRGRRAGQRGARHARARLGARRRRRRRPHRNDRLGNAATRHSVIAESRKSPTATSIDPAHVIQLIDRQAGPACLSSTSDHELEKIASRAWNYRRGRTAHIDRLLVEPQ